MDDDDNSEDSNYDPNADRVLIGNDELENEAFDDYVTNDSEFQSVRKDIPSNLSLPSKLDSDDLSHTPAPSDEDDFEEHMREKRRDILYDPKCDHAQLQFVVGMKRDKALELGYLMTLVICIIGIQVMYPEIQEEEEEVVEISEVALVQEVAWQEEVAWKEEVKPLKSKTMEL
ncbi:hypothetical protein GH714_025827 [Hevea brasiliensis]|uniref:Uncharacterized protein n=1 Tax=Hevea brasiliensis TaxID=3981 RepID=A0A6A6NJ27_HEVBR|nr:hypothetical protein GH714_025827 [Hevea brasiliensis]